MSVAIEKHHRISGSTCKEVRRFKLFSKDCWIGRIENQIGVFTLFEEPEWLRKSLTSPISFVGSCPIDEESYCTFFIWMRFDSYTSYIPKIHSSDYAKALSFKEASVFV